MKRIVVILLALVALLGSATAGPATMGPVAAEREGTIDLRPAPAQDIVIALTRKQLERVTQAGRVTVYAEAGIEDTATDLAMRAEAALSEINADLSSLEVPATVELRVVRDAADLAAVAPPGRGAPAWAVGVAYPDLGIISVALRRGPNVLDPVFTLRHELAHLALGAAIGPRAPRWLHEGFAYQHSPEYSRERVETLAGMAWFGSVIPLRELDISFPADELPANRAYAESFDFVGFLANRGRWEDHDDDGDRFPFRRFLYELGNGASIDAAAIRAYGRPIQGLFEEWRQDLGRRYRLMPIGLIGFAAWIFVGLLLVLAWRRRRSQAKRKVAQWDSEELARRARESSLVVAPPYVPWPGEDPLGEEPDEDKPSDPSLLN